MSAVYEFYVMPLMLIMESCHVKLLHCRLQNCLFFLIKLLNFFQKLVSSFVISPRLFHTDFRVMLCPIMLHRKLV